MKLFQWYYERVQDLLSWLFPVQYVSINLARVQFEEQRERRASLDRDLAADGDSQDCIARVRRRMLEGDSVWIAPRYNAEASYKSWRRKHRGHSRVERIEDRREA